MGSGRYRVTVTAQAACLCAVGRLARVSRWSARARSWPRALCPSVVTRQLICGTFPTADPRQELGNQTHSVPAHTSVGRHRPERRSFSSVKPPQVPVPNRDLPVWAVFTAVVLRLVELDQVRQLSGTSGRVLNQMRCALSGCAQPRLRRPVFTLSPLPARPHAEK